MLKSIIMTRRKRKINFITLLFIIIGVIISLFIAPESFNTNNSTKNNIIKKSHLKEADYVNMYCKGIIEYQLPDRTRVDCLTDEYAIEYDWAKKWAESIGQAMYYSAMTGRKPAVAIIIKNPYERVYIERIKKANPNIQIFEIKTENYKE